MNNEQETVKPEALVDIIEELANTPMQLPMGRWDEISNTLILASRALAATQKLEPSDKPKDTLSVIHQYDANACVNMMKAQREQIQKLEAEKAELQRENEMLRKIIGSTFKVLHGCSPVEGTENEASVIVAQLRTDLITALRSQLEGMTKALTLVRSLKPKNMSSHCRLTRMGLEPNDVFQICDTALTTQPQLAAGMEGEQS